MSDLERRRRLYRAVRLIPEVVSIPGDMEDQSEDDLLRDGKTGPSEGEAGSLGAEELSELENLREEREGLLERIDVLTSRVASSQCRVQDIEEMMRSQEEEFQQKEAALQKEREGTLEQELREAQKKGHEEGHHQGYEEGQKRAEEEAREHYKNRFGELTLLLDEVYGKIKEDLEILAEGNQHRLVRMWEDVLRSLLHRQVELNEATAMEVLGSVLQRLTDRDRIIVYLNPEDLASVTDRQGEFSEILRGIRHVEFQSDMHVDKGSCLVESNMGIYDARWRTQLERVAEEVNQVLLDEGTSETTAVRITEDAGAAPQKQRVSDEIPS